MRSKRYTQSVLSGYFLLGANTLYTLASVPLALRYLSKPEFALWAVVSMVAQYVGLIDFGMSGVSRILVDHKDNKNTGEYGGVIKTFGLVSLAQAGIIVLLGFALALILGPTLHVPMGERHAFFVLVVGQCVSLAVTFLSRILYYLLAAHQRFDVLNYIQAGNFGLNFAVLWWSFSHGQGVYSTLWAQGAAWTVGTILNAVWVVRAKLLPEKNSWGKATWEQFRILFAYGRDIFLVAVGFQLLNASQTIVLARIISFEAAAVWSICTRTYILISQVIFRLADYSGPAIAEMMVRQEKQLVNRFKSLVILSASCAIVAGSIFAATNQAFVHIWTHGKNQTGWPVINDVLLAVSLLVVAISRCHIGIIGQSKQIGFLRFIYLFEGMFFVSASLLVVKWAGVAGILGSAILGTLLFSLPYSTWRSSQYFNLPLADIGLKWLIPPLRLGLCVVPLAALMYLVARPLPDQLYLCVYWLGCGLLALPLLFRLGLGEELRVDLLSRLPRRLDPLVPFLGGRRGALK